MQTRRTVIASITLTLDGHTTGNAGPSDMSCVAPYGVGEQARDSLTRMSAATTVLLGRRNYEGFGGYRPSVATDSTAEPRDRAFAQWLDEVDKVVFSTTIDHLEWTNAQLATSGPVDTVRAIRSTPGGDIRVLASQSIIRQLLRAGEIDRLELTLVPVLTAGGSRLFHDELPPSSWTLAGATPTDTDAVQLTYQRKP